MNFFKIVSILTSLLFIFLFYQLFLNSDSFVIGLGLQSTASTSILSRRTSMFMLGLSILLFCSRNLSHSLARQYICLSTGITMLGLACMGSYELIMGTVNSSMMIAIFIEITLGTSFLIVFLRNRKAKIIQ